MKLAFSLTAALLVAAGTLSLPPASAAPIAHESFDYQAGSALVGSNGGSGFGGAWQSGLFSGGAQHQTGTGSLSHAGVPAVGGHAAESNAAGYWGVWRPLAAGLGSNGSTVYASFLIRAAPGAVASDFFGLYLSAANPFFDLFVGKPGAGASDRWVLERRGGADQAASDAVVDTDTHLLVLKMQFAAADGAPDIFSLFVDPVAGGAEPGTPDAVSASFDAGTFTGIGLFGNRAWAIDEIRLGSGYADVAAAVASVPEPSTWTLLVPALVAGWRRRRGRCAH